MCRTTATPSDSPLSNFWGAVEDNSDPFSFILNSKFKQMGVVFEGNVCHTLAEERICLSLYIRGRILVWSY